MTLTWLLPQTDSIPEEKAAAVLRHAAARRPDDGTLRLRLARVLYARDCQQEIVDLLAPLVARDDAPEEACLHYGRALLRLGDPHGAIAALRRAGETTGTLADAYFDSGRTDDALTAALEMLAQQPDERRSLSVASKVLLARGATRTLLDLCRDLRSRGGRNAEIDALLALSAWAQGAPECDALLDRRRFAQIDDLRDAAFNAALAGEISAHPLLGRSPGYKATRGDGVRIDHIGRHGGPLAQALLADIQAHIETYAAARAIDLPQTVKLASWALVLRGDGHETWHIHPAARISGVYYVQAPERAGEIGFGPLRPVADRDMTDFPSWTLTPRAGMLLLFPSHFAHRTWPTLTDAPRISVAFDVMPAQES
jgi:tetratricopeptide (TPR) repeat protein